MGAFRSERKQRYAAPSIATFHNILAAAAPPETLDNAIGQWTGRHGTAHAPVVRRPDLVQTEVRRSLLGLSLSSLAVAGSLLTAMAAIGAAGNGRSPRGPERSEGAAKRLEASFPAAHAASHMY